MAQKHLGTCQKEEKLTKSFIIFSNQTEGDVTIIIKLFLDLISCYFVVLPLSTTNTEISLNSMNSYVHVGGHFD